MGNHEQYSTWKNIEKQGALPKFALYGSMFTLLGGLFTGTIGLYGIYTLVLIFTAQAVDFIRVRYLSRYDNPELAEKNSYSRFLAWLFKWNIFGLAFFTIIGIIVITYNAINLLEGTRIFNFILTHWNRGALA